MVENFPRFESLFPPQQEILRKGFITSRDHWIVCLPTGTGKTLLGEWVLHDAVKRGFAGVYLSPLKAIVEEKYREWQQSYPEIRFGFFTGDWLKEKSQRSKHRPQAADVLLCTPERFDAYLRSWKRNLSWIANIDVLVVDELHMLADGQRGARLEALITRIRRLNPFTRIVGLSATLSNMEVLARWLHARSYWNHWRSILIKNRVWRFGKASEKFVGLFDEVQATLSQKGKVLVFTNSRKRAETISRQLQAQCLRSGFHHAGLSRTDRSSVEEQFRNGAIDILVATSTVEMGVNLPARKVVVFDSYAFSDDGCFTPLSVLSYVQRIGRAGRPGLDEEGESVLFLPSWHGDATRYMEEDIEPIRSPLFNQNLLAEQILGEVSSRLSITQRQLEKGFAVHTLWRAQGGKHGLTEEIDLLIDAGMIREVQADKATYLTPTGIGRLGVQLFLSPKSVLAIKACYERFQTLTYFDLLLTAALLPECQPRLWFDFEEIDVLGDRLISTPAVLLDHPTSLLYQVLRGVNERQVLSGLKMASLLQQRIQGVGEEELMDTYSCYPSDLRSLLDNAVWLLGGIGALYGALRRQEVGDDESLRTYYRERRRFTPLPEDLCRQLSFMVRYGITTEMLPLASIPGIGGRKARILWDAGYRDPEDLALAEVNDLARLPGFGPKSARQVIDRSEKVIKLEPLEYREEMIAEVKIPFDWPQGVDPYRLRRAFDLSITSVGKETTIVTGGSEPRRVSITMKSGRREYRCDCPDFEKRQLPCKHILRVQLDYAEGKNLKKALRELHQLENAPLRYGLGQLWAKSIGFGVPGKGSPISPGQREDRHSARRTCSKRR